MTAPKPGLYSIPPGVSFLDALATGVLGAFWRAADPLALTHVTILVPTRRAARALAEAFLRHASAGALLLPSIRPIGDVDEDELAFDPTEPVADAPPAISRLKRQLLLARLILKYNAVTGLGAGDPASAVALAGELANFIDEAESEGADLEQLGSLAPEAFAEHWTKIVTFLDLIRRQWPLLLAGEGAIDPAGRRNRMLRALGRSWRERKPAHPVIAAGSTGSLPATAELMGTILTLPQGFVVLPGLDTRLDNESWDGLNPSHPQFGLKLLLERLGTTRKAVARWPAAEKTNDAREALIGEALRPPASAEAWHTSIAAERETLMQGLDGVEAIEAPGPREEAAAVALRLREAIEDASATAALVTPDRTLARRVAAELQRWGIDVDDTGGTPLAKTDRGAFLTLVADAASPRRDAVGLLAFLKHPLTSLGRERIAALTLARDLEIDVLRGGATHADAATLRRAIADRVEDSDARARFSDFADAVDRALTPLAALAQGTHDIAVLARAHTLAAEAVAESDTRSGADLLWRGEAGSVAFQLLSELIGEGAGTLELTLDAYTRLFASLARGRPVRPRFGKHPRLFIWGPLEARLLHADVVILGGLNEGVWPQEAATDPWLSRPMRAALGLTEPERRIGLAAHDFTMLAGAPTLVLTRAAKAEGKPTDPSRFYLRLRTLADGLGADLFKVPHRALQWSAELTATDAIRPARAPQPRPPVAARPRRLSATQVETWIRDPYATYARHVLKLDALDPIGVELSPAQRGNLIHDALERFVKTWPDALPQDAAPRLIEIGGAVFAPLMGDADVKGFWWPRFLRVVDWFVALEREKRATIATIHAEISGSTDFPGPAGPFELRAKADRIEVHRDGSLVIVDYKTGTVPSLGEIKTFSPQLPLEAIIAEDGGFKDVAGVIRALEHIKLSGGKESGKVAKIDADLAALIAATREGLTRWIARFDDAGTPYVSRRAPKYMRTQGDYDQLARVAEWSALDGAEE